MTAFQIGGGLRWSISDAYTKRGLAIEGRVVTWQWRGQRQPVE